LPVYRLGPEKTLDQAVAVADGCRAGRFAMHYPHRISRIKRKRSIGFRARMKTTHGRKMMNRKRKVGRSLNVADK